MAALDPLDPLGSRPPAVIQRTGESITGIPWIESKAATWGWARTYDGSLEQSKSRQPWGRVS